MKKISLMLIIALAAFFVISANAQDKKNEPAKKAAETKKEVKAQEPKAEKKAEPKGDEAKGETSELDMAKISYYMGYNIAKSLKMQDVKVDVNAMKAAIEDVYAGKESKYSEAEMKDIMTNFQQTMMKKYKAKMEKEGAENSAKAKEFLEKNKKDKDVKETASGLQYKVIKEGKGKQPQDTDRVKVNYKGTLIDGTEFDSSYKNNEPAEFPVKGVIPGWTEALKLMKEGSKWQLFIPPALAYGEQGSRDIPPNSLLIFEVELIEIVKSDASGK